MAGRRGSASARSTSRTRRARARWTRSTRTCSRCSRTRRASCTWGTSRTTRSATSSRTSAGAWASASCARWATTPSAFRPRTPPSARAGIRASSPSGTSPPSASRCSRMGWAIDWDREVSSHEPSYYRWTQWLFLKFFEQGLAYRKEAPVNWCPNDQTVLANEQVIDGRCERCGAEVERRNLEQWFFRITAYADRAARRDEPARVVARARPDDAAQLDRALRGRRGRLPDRGAGRRHPRLHDAPGHALRRDVLRARARAPARAAARRGNAARAGGPRVRPPGGRPLGRRARRPREGEDGRLHRRVRHEPRQRGAPADLGRRLRAHGVRDGRDHGRAGARRARLRVRAALRAAGEGRRRAPRARSSRRATYVPHSEDERLVDSAQFSGLPSRGGASRRSSSGSSRAASAARPSATACATGCSPASATGAARSRSSTATSCGMVPVPEEDLPVLLPEVEEYLPKGRSPLAAAEDWVHTTCPRCGGEAHRETDTMDTFVDSSWYFIRYCDARNDERAVEPGDRRLLAARQPVHRRRRARDPAPALRALLREGAERPGAAGLPRAVPAPLHAGDDPLPRREDVQVEGQRRSPRRHGRALRRRLGPALHPLHGPGRGRHRVAGHGHRGHGPLPRPPLAARARGRRARPGRRAGRRPARAARARGDRQGRRRHPAPLPVQHADRGGDRARQRDLPRQGRPRARRRGALRDRDRGQPRSSPTRRTWPRSSGSGSAASGCGSSPGRRPTRRCSSGTRSSWSSR